MASAAEVIPAEAFAKFRKLEEIVREEARRIHADHTITGKEWSKDYIAAALRGSYDDNEELRALRAAIRRGIEIGRISS